MRLMMYGHTLISQPLGLLAKRANAVVLNCKFHATFFSLMWIDYTVGTPTFSKQLKPRHKL